MKIPSPQGTTANKQDTASREEANKETEEEAAGLAETLAA